MTLIQTGHRFVIDPAQYRTDHAYVGCLLIFWIFWVPVTAIVTALALSDGRLFFYIWLTFGYLGTIAIPYALISRNRKQSLEVALDSLIVRGTGILPSSSVRIERHYVIALGLGNYDEESIQTLNLWHGSDEKRKRISLAAFVHPKDKVQILHYKCSITLTFQNGK